MAACSSTSTDDSSAGGTGGTSSGGTSSGGTSAGTGGKAAGGTGGTDVGAAGDNGAAGAAECSFESDACTACLVANCAESLGACTNDNDCRADVDTLDLCVCGGSTSIVECETDFIGRGDLQMAAADCFDASCREACIGPN